MTENTSTALARQAAPTTATEVATLQHEAESLVPSVERLTIESADDYTFADGLLSELVRRKDAAVAMRKRATGPLKEAAREIESWFRPLVTALERCEAHLKGEIGRWRIDEDARALAARDAAAKAAQAGDVDAMHEALDTATAPSTSGRSTVRYRWAVKRIVRDLLLPEWLVPDEKRIAKLAREHKGDEPPVVPGVVFEREAIVGARR